MGRVMELLSPKWRIVKDDDLRETEKNIRMIIDKKDVLLADDKLNITKDVMILLNKQLKSIKLN